MKTKTQPTLINGNIIQYGCAIKRIIERCSKEFKDDVFLCNQLVGGAKKNYIRLFKPKNAHPRSIWFHVGIFGPQSGITDEENMFVNSCKIFALQLLIEMEKDKLLKAKSRSSRNSKPSRLKTNSYNHDKL